jgi:hypothetical protein
MLDGMDVSNLPLMLTPAELAELLRIPACRVSKMCRKRDIAACCLPDGSIRIPRDVVLDLITPNQPKQMTFAGPRLAGSEGR